MEQVAIARPNVKTLDWVFIVRAKEGRSRPLFEAQTLTDLVKIGQNAQSHPHLPRRERAGPSPPSPAATPSRR
jgi:hypothetical protein